MPNFRGTAGRIITSQNGIPIVNRTRNVNFLGGTTVVDAGSGQADVTPAGGGLAASWKAAINLTFASVSPIALYLAQINDRVITTQVIVTEVFDGVNPLITVGDAAVNNRLFESSMCDLSTLGEYESNNQYLYLALTQTNVYFNFGGSTQGRATVLIQIQD